MTTTREAASKNVAKSTLPSLAIYLVVMVFLVLVKVVLELASVAPAFAAQASLFGWPTIGFLAIAGGCSIWLAPRTGLPDLWEASVSRWKDGEAGWRARWTWLLLPAVVGLGLGAVNLVVLGVTGYAQTMAQAGNVDSINVPFPGSIPFYLGGAIVVEALYRLILITLPLWLVANVILGKRGQAPLFWALAILTSLLESVGLMSFAAGHLEVMLVAGVGQFGVDIFEAYLFRRYGFLAPLVHRIAFYLVWHVVGSVIGL